MTIDALSQNGQVHSFAMGTPTCSHLVGDWLCRILTRFLGNRKGVSNVGSSGGSSRLLLGIDRESGVQERIDEVFDFVADILGGKIHAHGTHIPCCDTDCMLAVPFQQYILLQLNADRHSFRIA